MKELIRVGIVASFLCSSALFGVQPQETPPSGQQQTQPSAPDSAQPPAQQPHSAEQKPDSPTPNSGEQKPEPSQNPDSAHQKPDLTSPAQPEAAPPAEKPEHDPNVPVLKRRPAHKPFHKKTTTTSSSGKVVVRNGGAKAGPAELAPAASNEQALHNRENTNQLLATTDANLKSVNGRALTPAQQGMVEQIHNYVSQSKAAANSGDLDRAHTLAYKAHLLSDELAKK